MTKVRTAEDMSYSCRLRLPCTAEGWDYILGTSVPQIYTPSAAMSPVANMHINIIGTTDAASSAKLACAALKAPATG